MTMTLTSKSNAAVFADQMFTQLLVDGVMLPCLSVLVTKSLVKP